MTVRNYENRGKAYYPPHQSIYEYTVKCQQRVGSGNDVRPGNSLRERQAVHCAGGMVAGKHWR
ncbi:MAG TPA: hypothetical protein EYN27_11435 [Rhodospirillales bacterium]|nr:hypothetical protein [Rhodospirillales bacterium]